jgi:hypothetical protein
MTRPSEKAIERVSRSLALVFVALGGLAADLHALKAELAAAEVTIAPAKSAPSRRSGLMAGQSNVVEALEARKRAKFISRRASPKRDENAMRERRAELRAVAKRRIAAFEADALTKIKMFCHDARSRVLAHGLTSASAIAASHARLRTEMSG